MNSLIALRKAHEGDFSRVTSERFDEICVLFRVGGCLGDFGQEALGDCYLEESKLCCEVILSARDWSQLKPALIDSLVATHFKDAVQKIWSSSYSQDLPELPSV